MQTAAAALDLSNFSISGVEIASTNATGTTFTVSNLATAYEVAGGPGQDTLVANGFTFTDIQRQTIFGQQSVEIVQDSSGDYLKAGMPVTVAVQGGATFTSGGYQDTFVFNSNFGNDTIKNFAATGVNHDTLQFHNIFADAQAVLNAAQDVGGNVVIALDANDSITLAGIHKADLSVSDFHLV